MDSVSPIVDPNDLSSELEVSDSSDSELETSSSSTSELESISDLEFSPSSAPSLDDPWIIITRKPPTFRNLGGS